MVNKKQLAEAKKLLEQHAPKGEFLAYINKEEAEILKKLGGSGKIIEATQIPSYEVTETRSRSVTERNLYGCRYGTAKARYAM